MQLRDTNLVLHRKGHPDIVLEAANQDLTNATYQYFGFMNTEGYWVIQRFQTVASAVIYRYAAGQNPTTYAALWNATTGIYGGSLTFYPLNTFLDNLQ